MHGLASRFPLALVLLLLAPRAVRAQDSVPSAASVLQPGVARRQLVRLTVEQVRVMGRLTGLTATQVALGTDAGVRPIDLSAIDTVWVPQSSAGRGALIGGLVGALALGVLGSVAVSDFCSNQSCNGDGALTGAAVGGAVGFAGGALVGALFGALSPRWKQRFP